jgi:hypothetical protein
MTIFIRSKRKINQALLGLFWIIGLASIALCLSLPTRGVAQVQISQSGAPLLAGISANTSFKALRESSPKANWHISESDKPYPPDSVHERRMFATNAVSWQGHDFDIYLRRGRFNNSTFIAVTDLNQNSEVDCQKRSFAILDELSKQNGFLADQWKPDHPRAPYQGTRVWWEIEQFRLFGLEPSARTFVQDAGEGEPTVRIAKTNEGIAIGYPEDPPLNFRRNIGWRSYYDNGQHLVGFVAVFGKFDFGLPEKLPSQCKVTIKIEDKGNYSLGNPTRIVNIIDRESIELVGSHGAAYGAIMEYDGSEVTTDDSAFSFECDIRAIPSRTTKIAGQFDNCKPLDDNGKLVLANFITPDMRRRAEYIGFFREKKWKIDEDNFQKNKVRLKFSWRNFVSVPQIKWDNNLSNINDFAKNISRNIANNIGANDYPVFAIRNELTAIVYFDCVVLDDLSPFCGRMRVEPKENTTAFGSIWRKFQRGIVGVKIDPKLEDGTSSVGKFFFKRLVFRLPDSERATDPAADR